MATAGTGGRWPVVDRMVALAPTETWEQNCVEEPNVYWDGTRWVMLYSGGWANERLGWATASTLDGPWVKQGVFASGGLRPSSGRSCILFDQGQMYVYYDGQVCHGPDIASMGAASTALAVDNVTIDRVTNASVIKDGATYRMIFDGKAPGGTYWKSGYATATSPDGPFTIQQFPLDLGVVMDGGPCLNRVGPVFQLWWHGGVGNLPNDIYHSWSSDCLTWHNESGPRIVRTFPQEYDQVADPFYVRDPASGGYLFWSAMNNIGPGSPAASIMRSLNMTINP